MLLKYFCDLFYCPKCNNNFYETKSISSSCGYIIKPYSTHHSINYTYFECKNKCDIIYGYPFFYDNKNIMSIGIMSGIIYDIFYDTNDLKYNARLNFSFSKNYDIISIIINSHVDQLFIEEYDFITFANKVQEIFKTHNKYINNLIFI
jgi:hypothetical protein